MFTSTLCRIFSVSGGILGEQVYNVLLIIYNLCFNNYLGNMYLVDLEIKKHTHTHTTESNASVITWVHSCRSVWMVNFTTHLRQTWRFPFPYKTNFSFLSNYSIFTHLWRFYFTPYTICQSLHLSRMIYSEGNVTFQYADTVHLLLQTHWPVPFGSYISSCTRPFPKFVILFWPFNIPLHFYFTFCRCTWMSNMTLYCLYLKDCIVFFEFYILSHLRLSSRWDWLKFYYALSWCVVVVTFSIKFQSSTNVNLLYKRILCVDGIYGGCD